MSTNDTSTCANCGNGEEAAGDLKACTACKLVKYCNRDCQIAHRPQHKKACKKRAAELHDEKLFKQPPPNEDCPICMIPLPNTALDTGVFYNSCCGKTTCSGCTLLFTERDKVEQKCPFCRTPAPHKDEEIMERLEKRAESGDANAIGILGTSYSNESRGLPQDHVKALEVCNRAAELGNASAYFNIGNAYRDGNGVVRDEKKAASYWELAAMEGHAIARHNLGVYEWRTGNMDRSLKHFMIAVRGGDNGPLENIKRMFKHGYATKDDYAKALRSYQAYLDEIKSPQRDAAVAFIQ